MCWLWTHEWTEVERRTVPPPVQMLEHVKSSVTPHWMFQTTILCVLRCKHCGDQKIVKGSAP